MGRILGRILLGLLVVAAVIYLGDFVLWQLRSLHGGATESVVVNRVVVAPLKGNKEEYYADGTTTVSCSDSLFTQTGVGACWWVKGHRTLEER